MINARSETVATKPSFRAAFKSRRCLVLADGFFEWKKVGKEKQPYYITRGDGGPFCMAGLWESWNPKNDEVAKAQPVETCTILTTDANSMMLSLHDRMPVIVEPDQYEFWMDPAVHETQQLQKILAPCPAEILTAVPVSKLVNRPTNDQPACIQPVAI
jgi:putative SOS response-associated peptidase YedK